MPFLDECVRCMVGGPASLWVRFGTLALFFPCLVGSILVAARLTKHGRSRDWAVTSVAIFTCVAMLFVEVVLTTDSAAQYSPLVLHETAFSWPAGCANREYSDGDEISMSCRDSSNTLPRKLVFDHGFRLSGRGEQEYFRVGSEAVNFACNYFTGKCTVRHAEHKVYG